MPKSSSLSAGIELMMGGVLLLAIALWRGEFTDLWMRGVTLQSVLALAYLIVFGSILAFSAYVWLLSTNSATRISTHTYINPLIAIALGWALADEVISVRMLIAAAVIVISVSLVLRGSGRDVPQESAIPADSREAA